MAVQGEPDDGLERVDIKPRRVAGQRRLDARAARRLAAGVSGVLVVVLLLAGIPALRGTLGRWLAPHPSATPSITSGVGETTVSSITITVGTPSGVYKGLGPAPTSCAPVPPVMAQKGNPVYGLAIGGPSVWVGGFSRTYPTLAFPPVAPNAFGVSNSPDVNRTRGWAAPITLVLSYDVREPVTLAGFNASTKEPLWFGFVPPQASAMPQDIVTEFQLDPQHPSVAEGGRDESGRFWYGVVFIPMAGCYTIFVTAPDNESWGATVSAGT